MCVCGLWWKGALRKASKLNAIVLTSMDTSKRSGITQSSPLKIPYKSLTERRISSVFTSGLTEISKLDELGSDRNLSPMIDIVTKFFIINVFFLFVYSSKSWHQILWYPWENQRYSAQVKAWWGLSALRCLLFGSYWPYECDAGGGGGPRDPPILAGCLPKLWAPVLGEG